jgi:autotransporter strand-loop-strand O-heptosyltransferase
MYSNLTKNPNSIHSTVSVDFVLGPKVEIKSPVEADYYVEFFNKETGELLHASHIKNNHWTKCLYQYFIDWHIKIYQKENGKYVLAKENYYNAENRKVYIALDSKALGDTIAWFPYVNEFRKKHKCHVVCSTFHNHLFQKEYPDIEFTEPGKPVNGIYAMYQIGWYYRDDKIDTFKNPNEVKSQAMQKTASDILGLEFKEIAPRITKPVVKKKKQIAIAIHSTAQSKYWNNPTGWQQVVDWCNTQGYEVVLLSKEGDSYMGNYHPKGIKYLDHYDIDTTITTLCESEAFIGISSGLSWLSWVTKTPTLVISGFTEKYTEPESLHRISSPEGKCSGCFNKYQLDAGDWNWCPVHKNTDRQFECSKLITSESVIQALKSALNR